MTFVTEYDHWSPVVTPNTALAIVLSVFCVVIILKREKTALVWGNNSSESWKASIGSRRTYNPMISFTSIIVDDWNGIPLRWKALNYWKSVTVMRQPVSNQRQPLKSYVIPSINWSPLWIFCLIYKLQRTFCRKYFLISLVQSGFSLRENENDGGESAGLQKGRMLLLELETDQKKFWLENLILLMLNSHSK